MLSGLRFKSGTSNRAPSPMSWQQPVENSVASLREGIERFDGIEFDLRLTCDNELVLHHDRNPVVSAEKKGELPRYVEDCTLDEICEQGFDSFESLMENKDFMRCWLEEARFVCLELKIPHPRSKAGGGWLAGSQLVEHLRRMMSMCIDSLKDAEVNPNNAVFYSFHSAIPRVNKSLGGDWNAVTLRPVVPPFGSNNVQRLYTLPQFLFNPLKRLIRRQRKAGAALLPVALEYLDGWTKHLPLGRSGSLHGKGLQNFNRFRGGDPVVVWQVEDRIENVLLEAGMSPLTDNADPNCTQWQDGTKRRFRAATLDAEGIPWHEMGTSQRRELLGVWRNKWHWNKSVDELMASCSSSSLPWQAVRVLGHRGCGKSKRKNTLQSRS